MIQDWRFLQDPDTMERISSTEMGARLDFYLERCDRENVGFVVEHKGKKYVLCPARWFDYPADEDFGYVVDCALRYSLGQNDCTSTVVGQFIRRHLDTLDARTLTAVCKNIEEGLTSGSPDYSEMWHRVLLDCKTALERKVAPKQIRSRNGGTSQ